jgi:acyl dehydratase
VRRLCFDNVTVGERFGSIEILADERTVREYCDEFCDHNPIYLVDSPFGGPVVPPLIQAALADLALLGTKYDVHSTIPAKTEHKLINPAKVGKRLLVAGKIIDKYVKRGLEYVVVESYMVDEGGLEIRRSVDHVLLSLERREPFKEESRGVFREEKEMVISDREAVVGMEIPPVVKVAYQRALHEYKFPSDSIHNSEYARSKGYAGPLVSGYVLCAYMSEMLVGFFGAQWLRGGEISLAFINSGVQEGDRVTCRGLVGKSEEGEAMRLNLHVWMEKGQGVKVAVGQASGVLRLIG